MASLYQQGVSATAAHSGGLGVPRSISDAAGSPHMFTSPATRQAYIAEVNRRVGELGSDILHAAPPAPQEFREEWLRFQMQFETWMEKLGWGALLLQSTQDFAARADAQVEDYRKRFAALGGKVTMPTYQGPLEQAPGGKPVAWGTLFTAAAVIVGVVGVVYVVKTTGIGRATA